MDIRYHTDLVEQAVFFAATQSAELYRQVHERTDPLYDLEDERKRRVRFTQTYLQFFQRLRLGGAIADLLDLCPLIQRQVGYCFVREASRQREEGAELFVNNQGDGPAARTVIIQVLPQSLVNSALMQPAMRRELWHIEDMLDDGFGYDKLSLGGHSPSRNLIRDRYRVLWDIYVEGRLQRMGFPGEHFKRGLSHRFEKVFGRYSACLYPPEFERIFHCSMLRHEQLLSWAAHPETLFDQEVRSGSGVTPARGALCPTCGFSTFNWYNLDSLAPELIAAVRRDHPDWAADKGLCVQCAETYISRTCAGLLQGRIA